MSDLIASKVSLRKYITNILKCLPNDILDASSKACCNQLKSLAVYNKSKVVSVYMSMPNGEFRTESLLTDIEKQNKSFCIPKIIGSKPEDMIMVRTSSMDQLKQTGIFNKWNILEPAVDTHTIDNTYTGIIDLVIIPGVAFDRGGNRLGHGKGYYGICIL